MKLDYNDPIGRQDDMVQTTGLEIEQKIVGITNTGRSYAVMPK
jgi:hypothetical protein